MFALETTFQKIIFSLLGAIFLLFYSILFFKTKTKKKANLQTFTINDMTHW